MRCCRSCATASAGIAGVDPAVIDAARGMGMTRHQLFWRVELPLALPLLFAGLRIVTVQAVGLAVVAALIGAGGLGSFVFEGLGQYAADLVLLGALPAILLALAADFLLQTLSALAARQLPAASLRPMIEIDRVSKAYDGRPRRRRAVADRTRRLLLRPARALGLRQIDDIAHDQSAGCVRFRHDPGRRRGCAPRPARGAAAADRLCDPVDRPLSALAGRGQHRHRAAPVELAAGAGARAGERAVGAVAPRPADLPLRNTRISCRAASSSASASPARSPPTPICC